MKFPVVVIKGAGDLASGVAHRLFMAGFPVCMTELENPLAVRRLVSFAEAVHRGTMEIEGVRAFSAATLSEAKRILKERSCIPVLVDPRGVTAGKLKPRIVIDGRMAKTNLGTTIDEAQLVIGLGPGFAAGTDVDFVIETKRGHNLGKVIHEGEAQADDGIPEPILGHGEERVLRAPCDGVLTSFADIGRKVRKGEEICAVDGRYISATINGVLRGMLTSGSQVKKGMKLGDIDPRGEKSLCFTISDKARAIGGGVLEAILIHLGRTRASFGVRRKSHTVEEEPDSNKLASAGEER
ncbi:MAG: selenium-dependent molybdenum cofactor biosynthesis protein YqeB [Candidatus Eisenbacteria bacterium]|nr:selenium-dependent molybdenum cofactor biosynthesis protein YqeB [Candidatus Eisenbacteria bacterium]